MHRVLVPYRSDDKVQPYLDALNLVGVDPVPYITERSPEFRNLSGVLLTGGTDLDPALYHQGRHPETETPDTPRDLVELDILSEALRRDLPVLAICRGLQLMNVHAGGTLIQHIESGHHRQIPNGDRSQPVHQVQIVEGSHLASVLQAKTVAVNTRHHQAVDKVGSGLRVSATDPADGTIEGLEYPDRGFVLAVQWHPEDQVHRFEEQLRLFQAFAQTVTYSPSNPSRA